MIETTLGDIECEYFVNCAGFCARNIGKLSQPNVKVPLHAAEHYYLVTKCEDSSVTSTPSNFKYLSLINQNIMIIIFIFIFQLLRIRMVICILSKMKAVS